MWQRHASANIKCNIKRLVNYHFLFSGWFSDKEKNCCTGWWPIDGYGSKYQMISPMVKTLQIVCTFSIELNHKTFRSLRVCVYSLEATSKVFQLPFGWYFESLVRKINKSGSFHPNSYKIRRALFSSNISLFNAQNSHIRLIIIETSYPMLRMGK